MLKTVSLACIAFLCVVTTQSAKAAEPLITITYPDTELFFPESDEFAGMVAGKPWDMTELYDITYRARFHEPFEQPQDGIWSGTFFGNDLPGHFWPLFRGWISTPGYLQYFTRHYPGTPYGPLNPIDADYYNRLSIRHALDRAKRSGVAINWCKTLLDTEANRFVFVDGDVARAGVEPNWVMYPDGFRIHDIDLTGETFNADRIPNISGHGFPSISGTWAGRLYGFYIEPTTEKRAGTEYSLDWIRLYHSTPETRINLTWNNAPLPADPEHISMQLYVAVTNDGGAGDLFLTGIENDGAMTFHTGALPPGDYYLYLTAVQDTGNGFEELARSGYSPLIRINARPTFEFTSPSFTSGVDYASADRANPWNMSGPEDFDASRTIDISNVRFRNGRLIATTTSDDPQIAMSLVNPSGVHVPIRTADYRYLTFRMLLDTSPYPSSAYPDPDARDFMLGRVARLQWVYNDFELNQSYTKDIILHEGWNDYTVDLWDDALLETRDFDLPNVGWTNVPEVNFFIFHPLESSVPLTFELDYIKLCAPNAPGGDIFPIRWTAGDADGDPLTVTLLYGTGAGDQFDGTVITTLHNQAGGAGTYQWNTAGIPQGEYTIRALVTDGHNTLVRDAPAPVIIGIGPPAPMLRANGMRGSAAFDDGALVTLTVELNPGHAAGELRDWWLVAFDTARGDWYYLNNQMTWIWFNGDLTQCRPAHQGPLVDLPPTVALDRYRLPAGLYYFYFAIDAMDGVLNYPHGPITFDTLMVTVTP